MNHKPYSFYKILPDGRFEFFVDATLLKSFAHCERYFYLHHIKNLRSKGVPGIMPFPMAIGRWWSDAMEMFYSALRDNTELTSQSIQDIAVSCWARNRLDLVAENEPERFAKFGDLSGAVLMLQEYHDSQYLTDKRNWKVIAVEEGFGLKKEVPLGETRNVVVYWVGVPDLVALENERLTPVDHKTDDYSRADRISRWKPSTQLPGYVHSCEVIAKSLGYNVRVDRFIVNLCSRERPTDKPRKGNKKPRFIRAYPNFTREEITEWKNDVVQKCERIAYCLKNSVWNWNELGCHNHYMRNCEFLKVDSTTPSARDIVLMSDFQVGEPWVPYRVGKEG